MFFELYNVSWNCVKYASFSETLVMRFRVGEKIILSKLSKPWYSVFDDKLLYCHQTLSVRQKRYAMKKRDFFLFSKNNYNEINFNIGWLIFVDMVERCQIVNIITSCIAVLHPYLHMKCMQSHFHRDNIHHSVDTWINERKSNLSYKYNHFNKWDKNVA